MYVLHYSLHMYHYNIWIYWGTRNDNNWAANVLQGTLISQLPMYLLNVGSKTRWAVKTIEKEKSCESLRTTGSRDKDVTTYKKNRR